MSLGESLPARSVSPGPWLSVTLLAFAIATGVMVAGSVDAGWGALGMAFFVSPIAHAAIAVVSAVACWGREGRFSSRVLLPFGIAVVCIAIVFFAAARGSSSG